MGQQQNRDCRGLNDRYIHDDIVKIKNIAGILYGKVSERFQESNDEDIEGLCFSFVLKDRTVDLSIAKETNDEALRRFVIGSSFVLNTYHTA